MSVQTKIVYRFDDEGYLIGDTLIQTNPKNPGTWMIPDDCTHEVPDLSKLSTHFVRLVDGQWTYEEIPTTASWFVGKKISHKSQKLHDRVLRALLQELVKKESEQYRVVRGSKEEGLYWSVEAIPEKTLEEVRTAKLSELDSAFMQWYEKDATVTTSLNFVADSDARAKMDVDGLVIKMERETAETRTTTVFMDAYNQPHELSLDQIKIVQLEIIKNGQSAYQQKWALRTAIQGAQSKEDLDAIEIVFTAEDFSK